MTRTHSLCIAVLAGFAVHAQQEHLDVHFATASAALDEQALATLSALCDHVGDRSISAITLSGHTDNSGSAAYNKELSQRRVQAVSDQLRASCPILATTELIVVGDDEATTACNRNATTRAADRRVDLFMRFTSPPPGETPCAAASPHAHSQVHPLLPTADTPRELHTIDAAQAIDITTQDGTRILIDANALVDENGRPVTGNVDLTYRSFKEPYAIIASGIPMQLKTPEGTEHLETAGMFEVYASQNGRALQLSEGKRIVLEQQESAPLDPAFTGWMLNDSTGAWQPGGSLASTAVATEAPNSGPPTTAAVLTYWQELLSVNAQPCPDTTLFNVRRASPEYAHLTRYGQNDPNAGKRKWHRAGSSIRVVGYKGIYDPDNIVFTVDITHDDAFPAWRRLRYPALWHYTGPESRAVFKRLYARRHYYQDVDVVLGPGAQEGTLRLKEDGEWLELPVDVGFNYRTERAETCWNKCVAAYGRTEAKQRARFDRDVLRAKLRYQRSHANVDLQAWKKAKRDMSPSEKEITQTDWKAYAESRRPRTDVLNSGAEPLVVMERSFLVSFVVSKFGICNMDRIMKVAEQQNVVTDVLDKDGHPFPWTRAYAVVRGRQTVVTYGGMGTGKDDVLLVCPGRMESLFLVDASGNVMTADTAPLNASDKSVVLHASPMDKQIDLDALRATAAR